MPQDMNNWQAESLRLTTFHRASSINLQSPDWWQRVTSDEPDQVISRPRDALVQQSGRFAGHQLMANARPDRVDWILHAVPNPTSGPLLTEPILGPMLQAIGSLKVVHDEWLKKCEPIIRLAFGAVLLQSVGDLNTAYKKMDVLLPAVNLKNVHTPDFLYQINRPTTSTVIQVFDNQQNKQMVGRAIGPHRDRPRFRTSNRCLVVVVRDRLQA